MANGPNEPRRETLAPPSGEEADRIAEQFRPSWEVDAPAPPPEASEAVEAPQAPSMSAAASPHPLKQTLLGITPQNLTAAPAALGKRTLVGIGLNEALGLVQARELADAPRPPASEEPPAEPVKKTSSRPPTPVPSDVFDGAAADFEAPPAPRVPNIEAIEQPSGVAKPYRPKEGLDVPAVVVAPAALAASEAAVRARRLQTIPGTLRAPVSHPPAHEVSFDPPRSAKPLSLVVGTGLAIGAVTLLGVLFWGSGEGDTPSAPVLGAVEQSAPREPKAEPEPSPPPAKPVAQPAPEPRPELTPSEAPRVASFPTALPSSSPERTSVPEPSDAGSEAAPAQKPTLTPSRKVPLPKKSAGTAHAAGTPAKSKPVIVRESPF